MHDQLRSDGLRSTGPKAIIVMGVSGSGKSTLGSALARALKCEFLEGDEFHSPEAVARMACGIPLTDEDRWPWLDRLGRAIGAKVAKEAIVVAACSALRRVYRERLRKAISAAVSFVLVDADRDELMRRMSGRIGHYMPPSLLDSQSIHWSVQIRMRESSRSTRANPSHPCVRRPSHGSSEVD